MNGFEDLLVDGYAVFDSSGRAASWEIEERSAATMVVSAVTDAVKEVVGERVVGSLDRDTLWSVVGFALRSDVVAALHEEEYSIGELIKAVEAAGFQWSVLRASSFS